MHTVRAIKIRRARASDKKVVLDFCKSTWRRYGDYIDKVWDEWVKDKKGFFAVACLDGTAIGTAKLTVLRPKEMWFEGLRVARPYRGLGISHILTNFLIKKASRMGAKSIRYATAAKNPASQHIGKACGFSVIGGFSILWAPSDGRRRDIFTRISDPKRALSILKEPGATSVPLLRQPAVLHSHSSSGWSLATARTASTGRRQKTLIKTKSRDGKAVDEITRLLSSCRFTGAMNGLASEGWTFFRVDTDLVADCLHKGEFFIGTWPKNSRKRVPLGVLIASAQRSRQRLLLRLVADLREDALGALLSGVRKLAYELDLARVRLVAPRERAILAAARAVGFKQEHQGFYHIVMERPLRAARRAATASKSTSQDQADVEG